MDKPKILIVDDDTGIRDLLKAALTRDIESEIQEAGDGDTALKLLDKGRFDLILLDIKMRGISGIDVLKKTKQAHPETDILVLSGWDSQQVATEVLKAGAIDYIPKPSPINVICDKVREILKKKNKFIPKK